MNNARIVAETVMITFVTQSFEENQKQPLRRIINELIISRWCINKQTNFFWFNFPEVESVGASLFTFLTHFLTSIFVCLLLSTLALNTHTHTHTHTHTNTHTHTRARTQSHQTRHPAAIGRRRSSL